jgi:LmbE family N-acetylglucosaminyl deacetylase
MIEFQFNNLRTILCLGAHSDDIEIGCGGTLLKLARAGRRHPLTVHWIVFSAEGSRAREARQSAASFLKGMARSSVVVKKFENSYFPYEGRRIKAFFEQLKRKIEPDLVLTHYRNDRHQDHRVLSDLAWNTFRNHLVFEYEIPKYDGDLGIPNVFVTLDAGLAEKKAELICRHFQTQGNKHWFSPDTFLSLMRLRGMECASATKYAEAFHCRKLAWNVSSLSAASEPSSG